jgi:hypothetical protein
VNKYRNIKHRRHGSVMFPGRPELEEHLAGLPQTSDVAGDSLRGPRRWSAPPLQLPRPRKKTKFLDPHPYKLPTKYHSYQSSLIREACSGLTWCPAALTALREETLGVLQQTTGSGGGDAGLEWRLVSVEDQERPSGRWMTAPQ